MTHAEACSYFKVVSTPEGYLPPLSAEGLGICAPCTQNREYPVFDYRGRIGIKRPSLHLQPCPTEGACFENCPLYQFFRMQNKSPALLPTILHFSHRIGELMRKGIKNEEGEIVRFDNPIVLTSYKRR